MAAGDAGFLFRARIEGTSWSHRSAAGWNQRRAIAMPRQDAVLGLPQLRNADGQPDSRGGQADGKNEGGEVCQHPMPEFVLIAHGWIIGRSGVPVGINARPPRTTSRGRGRKGARGEFDHARAIVGLGWHLNFHSFLIGVGRYCGIVRPV